MEQSYSYAVVINSVPSDVENSNPQLNSWKFIIVLSQELMIKCIDLSLYCMNMLIVLWYLMLIIDHSVMDYSAAIHIIDCFLIDGSKVRIGN